MSCNAKLVVSRNSDHDCYSTSHRHAWSIYRWCEGEIWAISLEDDRRQQCEERTTMKEAEHAAKCMIGSPIRVANPSILLEGHEDPVRQYTGPKDKRKLSRTADLLLASACTKSGT